MNLGPKLLYIALLLIVECGFAQTDTLFLINASGKNIKTMRHYYLSSVSDTIYIFSKQKNIDFDKELKLFKTLEKGYFCVFYDTNHNKMEECFWDGENLNGSYKSYYSNGIVKSEGKYRGSLKTGKWIYYKKNKQIEKEECFNDESVLIKCDK